MKRKSDGATANASEKDHKNPGPSAKRQKKSEESAEKPRAPVKVSKLSVLREEEPAFPRGGASVLTPLEHKQIQIQATRDVLFEQNTGKNASMLDLEGEDDEENEGSKIRGAPATARRKARTKAKSGTKVESAEDQGIRVEPLSYRVFALRPSRNID